MAGDRPTEHEMRSTSPAEWIRRRLGGEIADETFSDAMWTSLWARISEGEIESARPALRTMPPAVRAYLATVWTEFQVGNGGFSQAAYNDLPETFELLGFAAEGFRLLGRPELSDVVVRAIAIAHEERAHEYSTESGDEADAAFDARIAREFTACDDEIDDDWYARPSGWVGEERLELVRRFAHEFDEL